MLELQQHAVFLVAFILQIAGLSSAAFTRLGERWRLRVICNGLFFLCMIAMTAAAILAISQSSGYWMSYGTTLAIMSLIATVDFRHTSPAVV
jgi:hypothetical protein